MFQLIKFYSRIKSLHRMVILGSGPKCTYILFKTGPSRRAVQRRRSRPARLLRSWVQIPPGTWMFVCCECCVLSGRGLCDELITRPEKSYRLWWVVVCDQETSRMRRPWPALGRSSTGYIYIYIYIYVKEAAKLIHWRLYVDMNISVLCLQGISRTANILT